MEANLPPPPPPQNPMPPPPPPPPGAPYTDPASAQPAYPAPPPPPPLVTITYSHDHAHLKEALQHTSYRLVSPDGADDWSCYIYWRIKRQGDHPFVTLHAEVSSGPVMVPLTGKEPFPKVLYKDMTDVEHMTLKGLAAKGSDASTGSESVSIDASHAEGTGKLQDLLNNASRTAASIYTRVTEADFNEDCSEYLKERLPETICTLLRMAQAGSEIRNANAESAQSSEMTSNAPRSTIN